VDKLISLCIARQREDMLNAMFCRIADLNTSGELETAYYSNIWEQADAYKPMFIGNQKYDIPVTGDVQFRQWEPLQSDHTKSKSEHYVHPFYEIVFCDELANVSIDQEGLIREILYRGIKLPDHVHEDFLITLKGKDKEYKTLVCKTSYFQVNAEGLYRIPRDCSDIQHIQPYLDVINVCEDEMISLRRLNNTAEFDDGIEHRYFFIYTNIEQLICQKLQLYSIADYAPVFIKRNLKASSDKYNITTKKKINEICDVVKEILSEEKSIELFYQQTGYDSEQVIKELDRLKDVIIGNLLQNDGFSLVMRRVLINDEGFYLACKNSVKEEWLSEADDDRKAKEDELRKLELGISALREEIKKTEGNYARKQDEYKNQIAEMNAEILQTNDRLNKLSKRKEEMEAEFEGELQDIQNSLVKQAILKMLFQQGSVPGTVNDVQSESKSIFIKTLEPQKADETDNMYDFKEDLVDNLSFAGMSENIAAEAAEYLVGNLILDKFVICEAYYANAISDAISNLVDGCDATVVFVNGNEDISSLITQLKSIRNRVILIENGIDNFTDSLLVALNRALPGKYIICSYLRDESIKCAAEGLWDFAALMNNEGIMTPAKSPEFIKSNFSGFESIDITSEVVDLLEKYSELHHILGCNKKQFKNFMRAEAAIGKVNSQKAPINYFSAAVWPNMEQVNFDDLENICKRLLSSDAFEYFKELVN